MYRAAATLVVVFPVDIVAAFSAWPSIVVKWLVICTCCSSDRIMDGASAHTLVRREDESELTQNPFTKCYTCGLRTRV